MIIELSVAIGLIVVLAAWIAHICQRPVYEFWNVRLLDAGKLNADISPAFTIFSGVRVVRDPDTAREEMKIRQLFAASNLRLSPGEESRWCVIRKGKEKMCSFYLFATEKDGAPIYSPDLLSAMARSSFSALRAVIASLLIGVAALIATQNVFPQDYGIYVLLLVIVVSMLLWYWSTYYRTALLRDAATCALAEKYPFSPDAAG